MGVSAYFATNVRKKCEAESGVYLAPPILLGFIWFYLFLFGWPAEPAAWRVIRWLKAWATAVPSNRVALYAL
jgi:hypothetical protein